MDKGNLFLIAVFFILAGLTWWLNNRDMDETSPQSTTVQHAPDFYMENVVSTEMDEQGVPARQLFSQSIIHYSDDNSTDYLRPRLMVLEHKKPPWEIRSSAAHQAGDGKNLELQGKVNIDRESGDRVKPVHLITRDLKINTVTEFAETDQPVLLMSLKDITEGIGMQAWMKAPMQLKLLSKVRGHYDVEN